MGNDYSTTACADLEIGLRRGDAESYNIEVRFSLPGSDVDIRLLDKAAILRIDDAALLEKIINPDDYGQQLTKFLFADTALGLAFDKACLSAQENNAPLRLRLLVSADASELHKYRWETLRYPQDGGPLLTGEQVLFSRYLNSYDWRPVHQRSLAELRALVMIANPANLSEYSLAPVDIDGELARVKKALAPIPVTTLAAGEKASLATLSAKLHEGCDIFYLVCHGLNKDEPRLFLEDDNGQVARIPGSELVIRLQELRQRPHLVVLASCQSAGGGNTNDKTEGILAALGPRLATAGIPAVLAMQGNVTMETVTKFMPVFFAGLRKHGQIDRAVAEARGAVRERTDSWMPVLFMRLKSGRLWYTPSFTGSQGIKTLPTLVANIRQGRCTPILGPGLSESLLGSRREIARRWAETYGFPMAPHDQEDLPQVAQYLAVKPECNSPSVELHDYLCQELLKHYASILSSVQSGTPLKDLIATVGKAQREQQGSAEPHAILASLPFPIYITTNYGNLLEEALRANNKEPQIELCRWNEDIEQFDSVFKKKSRYRPSPEQPLVYKLFGSFDDLDSLVLTEDDHFDFLIGATRNRDLIPPVIRRNLANGALLFLGFEMADWNFRVLYRSLITREGAKLRKGYAHIAAQINPEEGRILETEGARHYLETYFQGEDINIYWGNVEDFLQDLQRRWQSSNT